MNFYALGFGAIALAAVGAIDYTNQSHAAGHRPGAFPASAYFATYGGRIADLRGARADAAASQDREARRSAGARIYLPDAPEGWSRRAWSDGDNSTIQIARRDLSAAAQAGNDAAPLLKTFADKAKRKAEAVLNDETWVYQAADGLVAVRAAYQPVSSDGPDDSFSSDMPQASVATSQGIASGWGIVRGVAFGTGAPAVSRAGTPLRAFHATIGFDDAVHLTVHSSASDAATRAVLSAIDYDGINSLLAAPLPYVGSQAQPVAPELQQQMASLMIRIREDLLTRRSAAAQDWLQRASTPENAMQLALSEIAKEWGTGAPMETSAAVLSDGQGAALSGSGAGRLAGFVSSILGRDTGGAAQAAAAEPPKRLKLSGGISCLEGSSGRFCRD